MRPINRAGVAWTKLTLSTFFNPYCHITVALKVLRPRITMSDNGTKLS